jgi:hypothetical protein
MALMKYLWTRRARAHPSKGVIDDRDRVIDELVAANVRIKQLEKQLAVRSQWTSNLRSRIFTVFHCMLLLGMSIVELIARVYVVEPL